MNNISDIFGQGRSFGPLGSDFGGNSTSNASGGSIGGGVGAFRSASVTNQQQSVSGVISSPSTNNLPPILGNNTPSSQPIGAGRNVQNVSPSVSQQSQQIQQRNGWSAFTADTWNPSAISS